ncbi:MAG: UDP-glucose/GDP-mannose dehydrogenase family protein [Deltaproteobacteria bacterium]|nr:UDP-glucose/GDP-mannose dehydrogenase family protein [Deltaproteobacteria bacterium]
MRIAVVGTGYVGLVAGACFAEFGHHVTCIDTDKSKIARLEKGEIPIYEPGLDEVVLRNRAAHRLEFTTDLAIGSKGCEVVIIAVGTPQSDDGAADMRYVLAVAEQLAGVLKREAVIVLKSTVPVGTNDRVQALLDRTATLKHRVVNNPEFLKEGEALSDFFEPDRVVIGVRSAEDRAVMEHLYAPMKLRPGQLMFMDPRSAEMTKYVANAMLATRISFMNEIAVLCEAVGADIAGVRTGVGSDPRIGPQFLMPGPGYGGSCFPKDVKALMHLAVEHQVPLRVIDGVDAANTSQKKLLAAKLTRALGTLKGRTIAVWGLAFKAKTDDVRESPALALIEQLVALGATVRAHDPEAIQTAREALGELAHEITFVKDKYDASEGADALCVVTEWAEYREPDLERLHAQLREKVLMDGRNLWAHLSPQSHGFRYEGIGILVNKPS